MKPQSTALELLKAYGSRLDLIDADGSLKRLVLDKGYDPGVIVALSRHGYFGQLVRHYLLRSADAESNGSAVINHFGERVFALEPGGVEEYAGDHVQNVAIDRALSINRVNGVSRFGAGAATDFTLHSTVPNYLDTLTSPIGIIGYGASGILTANALLSAGFTKVTVYDRNLSLGIWGQPNVANRTRNNPQQLGFLKHSLKAAPGAGREVSSFLQGISTVNSNARIALKKTRVLRVIPGNYEHTVISLNDKSEEQEEKFPILINAMGLGKPRSLSDPERMTTEATQIEAGPRWQQELRLKDVRNKRIILIGLGNSTAEMLRQIHEFIDEGHEVDYRIVTHYPEEAVQNPDSYVSVKKNDGRIKNLRVFRDLSLPNLTAFQGDLPDFRFDYYRALRTGKIITDVDYWRIYKDDFDSYGHNPLNPNVRISRMSMSYDHLFTLTGYRHSQETFEQMGCIYDPINHCALFDYDGEVIKNYKAGGGDRLHKGYFGFGPVLESPYNRNAVVIPGMIHRIGDLVFGIAMRAAEYRYRQQE